MPPSETLGAGGRGPRVPHVQPRHRRDRHAPGSDEARLGGRRRARQGCRARSCRLPEADRAVGRGRDDPPLGGRGQSGELDPARQDGQLVAGLRVPDADRAEVGTGGQQRPLVRREPDGLCARGAREDVLQPSVRRVVDQDAPFGGQREAAGLRCELHIDRRRRPREAPNRAGAQVDEVGAVRARRDEPVPVTAHPRVKRVTRRD